MNKETVRRIAETVIPAAIMITGSVFAFNTKVKQQVREEQGHACAVCGQKGCIQIHHIVPQCLGGADERENAVGLCGTHHLDWDVQTIKNGVMYPGMPIEEAPKHLVGDHGKFEKGVSQILQRVRR
jgi:predicted restriction endonuclease